MRIPFQKTATAAAAAVLCRSYRDPGFLGVYLAALDKARSVAAKESQ